MKNNVRLIPGSLADEILKYLVRHPQAQDTVEGIVEWWLMEQRIVNTSAEVKVALAELTELRFLEKCQGMDGRTSYRLNPRNERQIGEMLHGKVQTRAKKELMDS